MSATVERFKRTPRVANNSQSVLQRKAAHELFFAVVGPVGAGSSHVARQLARCLATTELRGELFSCQPLKAGDVIRAWKDSTKRLQTEATATIDEKIAMQGYGDAMREERGDNAAVAVGLIELVAEARAKAQGKKFEQGKPVEPDGKPRAYILDSLKHPAEAQLLRRLYGDAFVLIAVVCSEPVRRKRLLDGFFTGRDRSRPKNIKKVERFMQRDADDPDRRHGQHVADTFQEADFFVDNTPDVDQPSSGDMKDVVDTRLLGELTRLISIIVHQQIQRPTIDETAMHMAYSAKLRSSCLSRQVGAALVDRAGNIVATGTNEVPKAGGGVYGEESGRRLIENRCAFCDNDGAGPFCSNNKHQNELINEAIDALFPKEQIDQDERLAKVSMLRKTQIGSLLEFSRSVHAEMDALLSAARSGVSPVGTRLFVTTFPCHYCARHIVSAGVYEVQYIEPYPKSRAITLHGDAIETVPERWLPPRETSLQEEMLATRQDGQSGRGELSPQPATAITVGKVPDRTGKVLFRPFVGVAPKLYPRVFLKDRDYKDKITGEFRLGDAEWGSPWSQHQVSYARLEAELASTSAPRGSNG